MKQIGILGGQKSVSSGIGREFRTLSAHFLYVCWVCLVRNAIDIVTHKKWHTRRIWLEKSVSSGIGREFRALSVAQKCIFRVNFLRNAIDIATHKYAIPAESGLKKVCLLGSVENSGHFPLRKCVFFVFFVAQCNRHRNTQKWHTRRIRLEKSVSSGIGREFRALSVALFVYLFYFWCAMQ